MNSELWDQHVFKIENDYTNSSTAIFLNCSNEESSHEMFIENEAEEISDEFPDHDIQNRRFSLLDPNFVNNENDRPFTVASNNYEISTDDIFICNHCNKIFDQKYSLENHISIHLNKNYYKRNIENSCKIFPNAENSDGCRKCDDYIAFRTRSSSKKNSDGYCCHEYGEMCTQNVNTEGRMNFDWEKKVYECSKCDKSYVHLSSLLIHEFIHKDVINQCQYCHRIFPLRSNMIVHESQHSQKSPFKCVFCAKVYIDKKSLIQHVRHHINEKPYTCRYCDKKFAQQSKLLRHEKIHTGERPIICMNCGKALPIKNTSLPLQQTSQLIERMLICDYCGATFKQRKHLLSHIKMHLRPFKGTKDQYIKSKMHCCGYCDKRFTNSTNLKSHLLTHSSEKAEPENKFLCSLKSRFKLLLSSHAAKQNSKTMKVKNILSNEKIEKTFNHKLENSFSLVECKPNVLKEESVDLELLKHERIKDEEDSQFIIIKDEPNVYDLN